MAAQMNELVQASATNMAPSFAGAM
jgi:hypothetical protein